MSNLPRPFFQSFRRLGRNWFKRTRPTYLNNKPSFEFTVASYNVLADQLLNEHPHLYFSRGAPEPWVFDWNYRKKNLLAEIAYSNADVLCLQEVQEEHYYNWFHPQLKEYGYTGIYNKRSGNKRDGCATFFKHELFSMEFHQLINFYKPNSSFMDRDNVAILVVLSPRAKNMKNVTPICIGNTHLLFNKKRGDIKLAQLAHLFAEIDRCAVDAKSESNQRIPTIICGDFNSSPFSPLYDFVTNGELHFQGVSKASISGQEDYQIANSGKYAKLKDYVYPADLELTHTCKWQNGGRHRRNITSAEQNPREYTEKIDLTTDTPSPSHQIDLTQCDGDSAGSASLLQEERGYLRHDLDFKSSYMHNGMDGTAEVTTCHDRACLTVDYIFYSPDGQKRRISRSGDDEQQPDRLWLSGVLSLLSEYDLQQMGKLPNKNLSSDHLMLMSSFVLH